METTFKQMAPAEISLPPIVAPPRHVRLGREWGQYAADSVLAVLGPGMDPERGFVDAQRAEQLVTDGFGAWYDPAAEVDPAPRRRRNRSAEEG
jgi:hypothetical protein